MSSYHSFRFPLLNKVHGARLEGDRNDVAVKAMLHQMFPYSQSSVFRRIGTRSRGSRTRDHIYPQFACICTILAKRQIPSLICNSVTEEMEKQVWSISLVIIITRLTPISLCS